MARVVFTAPVPTDVTLDVGPLAVTAAAPPEEARTSCGWPYEVNADPDGTLVARYRFLDHEAIVRARGPRDAALAVLATARPDWHGDDVIALLELWEAQP